MTQHFYYFAYGSNMLSERLKARCQSAESIGSAELAGHVLDFSKPSKDGSGKATPTISDTETVHGVLFYINLSDLDALDKAEGRGSGYDRKTVSVYKTGSQEAIEATTYFASSPTQGLKPFDWYLALVLAGAVQHELPEEYRQQIASVDIDVDQSASRRSRLEAIEILNQTGFSSLIKTA